MDSLLSQIFSRIKELITYIVQWVINNPATMGEWYSAIIRWVMPILALAILTTILRTMLKVKNPVEIWGHLQAGENVSFPILHWECTVGRAKHCDILINMPTVSRTQCSLTRQDDGSWLVYNLSQHSPTCVNGQECTGPTDIAAGDRLSFGSVDLTFAPMTEEEMGAMQQKRRQTARPAAPWRSMLLLSLFQILTAGELALYRSDHALKIAICFGILMALMWSYVLGSRILGRRGFEAELLAFFSCTLCLAVVASSAPSALPKQTIAIILGVFLFLALGIYLRDLTRTTQTRHLMGFVTIGLLALSLIFGTVTNGAQNWITIAGISVQPSELAKITFIFAGAATLDRLFDRHNLWMFIAFSVACMGMLALMSDFGGASIFFVVFLIIAFLRSGDFATLSLITAGAAAAIGLMLRFKPYIAERFATWGHAWEFASSGGYQQVRAMSAAASGGLIGVGGGNGWLRHIAASDTDLVFALVCEEWGLIIALLLVASIISLAIFTVRVTRSGRSSFYTIAACAAASLLVFQTTLNVLGSVDLLPLTGVTFPFLSNGGTSMLATWGLLAFIKAADTRQDASFAVRRHPQVEQDEEEEDDSPPQIIPPTSTKQEPVHDPISEAFDREPDFNIFSTDADFSAKRGGGSK